MDKRFRVVTLAKTPLPQSLVYLALHQDYSEKFAADELRKLPSEDRCGEIAVSRLLSGGRGHYGCLEHPQITVNCGGFPHSVIQQGRTHRLTSWDVQSLRYTGARFLEVALGDLDVEDVFYLRPEGVYTSRSGNPYSYTSDMRQNDRLWCVRAAQQYKEDIDAGMSEEHARGKLPFDYRQNFVVSFNARSLMHFLDLRAKMDAQLEIQQLATLLMGEFRCWMPTIAEWYEATRLGKAKLAP